MPSSTSILHGAAAVKCSRSELERAAWLQLARAGVRVTGLDASPAMLAIATEKATHDGLADRVRLFCRDMRGFELAARSFDVVICPFRAFQLILTAEDQLAVLAAFRRHLKPDG